MAEEDSEALRSRLEEERDRLARALAGSTDGLWEWWVDGDEAWWSPSFHRLLGLAEGEVAAALSTFRELVHPDDEAPTMEAVRAHLEERVPFDVRVRMRSKSGEYRWFRSRGQAEWGGDGRPTRMAGSIQDITDLVAVEQSLLRTQDELQRQVSSVLSSVVDGIVIIDERGSIESFNRAAERMFGYTEAELLGRNVRVLMPSPYREEHDGYIESYLRTGEGKIIGVGREVVGQRKDGSRFPLQLGVSVLEGGAERRFTGILRDLTREKAAQEELRRNEERFSLVTRATDDAIWDADLAAGTLWCSDRHTALYGEAPASWEAAQPWWRERIHPDDRERTVRAFAAGLAGREDRYVLAYRYRRVDGGYDDVLDHFLVLRDAAGGPLRVIGAMSDVSDRIRLQDELLQAQKMEAVGRLAGGIAHDFNNLLMGIMSACRIVEQHLDDANPARPIVEDVKVEIQNASGLTRQLLDFSRRRTAKTAPVDLREAVAKAEKMLRHLVGEDVELTFDPGGVERPVVDADVGKLNQVLMNLVVNARDAMPRGGRLFLTLSSSGGGTVLAVRDTGCGMDAETRSRVFEPFFTTKAVGKGTGLGLSTVFGIMQDCGGRVEVDSAPDRGTTFRLWFPSSDGESAAAAARAGTEARGGGGGTVLVVEDERLVRQGLRMLLDGLGYEVLTADRPSRALAILDEEGHRVDLLLTDIVMPEMGGPELAQRVLADRPDMKVVYMSAYSAESLVDQGRIPAGAAVLEKPFEERQLGEVVRSVLGR